MNQASRRYLFHPWLDAVLLGGGSLVVLALLYWGTHAMTDARAWSLSVTLLLANLVNHPHFAVSYQIFYSNYPSKLKSSSYPPSLRWCYLLVGVVVPLALIVAFASWIRHGDAVSLGLSVNLMFFLVGWHYIKQGYGMAMVDAALKKCFYSQIEKRIILINGYAIWLLAWVWANSALSDVGSQYFGIPYRPLPISPALLSLLQIIAVLTTLAMINVLWRRHATGVGLAWSGFVGYLVSAYVWLLVRDPILLLWYPLFHSLQYLAVVTRFQRNRFAEKTNSNLRLIFSVALSVGLGYYFFWEIPTWLDRNVNYDPAIFGTSLFMFLFWIFINIHHYFIDTVMWRKENVDVKKYLFSR